MKKSQKKNAGLDKRIIKTLQNFISFFKHTTGLENVQGYIRKQNGFGSA